LHRRNLSICASFAAKLARLTREEGRIAIVTNAGWDVVDAAAFGVKRDGRAGFGLSQTRRKAEMVLLPSSSAERN
jgi:hypothetical protein